MKHLKGLEFPDAQTADRLSQSAPEDKAQMERIFRKSEAKFHALSDQPAEEVTYRAETFRPRHLTGAFVSIAACAVLAVSGWGLWRLSQQKPPMQPGESVGTENTVPFWDAISGEALAFSDHSNPSQGFVSITEEQRTAFLSALGTIRWEVAGEYETYAPEGQVVAISVGTNTPAANGFMLCRDEERFLWSQADGSVVNHITAYHLSKTDFDLLYAIVYGAQSRIPFRAALETAFANGQEILISQSVGAEGNPDLTQEQLDAFLAELETLSWEESATPYSGGDLDAIYLYIPGETVGDTQTVVFNRDSECILWEPSAYSDVIHFYPLTTQVYDRIEGILFRNETPPPAETPDNAAALDLTLTAKDITPTGLVLTATRSENASGAIGYGESFSLEEQNGDTWRKVTPLLTNYAFTTMAYTFTETTDISVDWEWLYGALPAGNYRLVKDFLDWREDGAKPSYTLYIPFTITDASENAVAQEDLPFRIEDFLKDFVVGMEPAYAPAVATVPANQLRDIAAAMWESDFIEVAENEWDGESTILYALGGLEGSHYSLTFAPNGTMIYEDSTQRHVYRVSQELSRRGSRALDYLQAMDDPSLALTYCKVTDHMRDSIWTDIEKNAEENDTLSAYRAVTEAFNATHGTNETIMTRQDCENSGIHYAYYLWTFAGITPDDYKAHLEAVYEEECSESDTSPTE